MTDQDRDQTLLDDRLLVVESFLDGERVDPAALKEALADPAARDHLADVLLLRDAVARMAPHVWPTRRHAGTTGRAVTWLAAAAAVIVAVAAGFFAGQRVMASAPPPSHIEVVVGMESGPVAPVPTRVIALQPGVNWTNLPGER